MKATFLVLLISIWLLPVHAEEFYSGCKAFESYPTEEIRDGEDLKCFREKYNKYKKAHQTSEDIIIYIKAFMSEVNKGNLAKDFAIFLFSFKTELVNAGFTEKQAMIFLSFSGQLLYQESQEE